MQHLDWFSTCVEQQHVGYRAMPPSDPRTPSVHKFREAGALVATRSRVVLCPQCHASSVRLLRTGGGYCPTCGRVELRPVDFQRWVPDSTWLRRRIVQALGLKDAQPLEVVAGHVWRLGDVGRGGSKRRVLFGERLAGLATQRALHAAWRSHVGETPAILVTTTPPEQIFLPGLPVEIVPLVAAFRMRGSGLVADEAVWAGVPSSLPPNPGQPRVGPFDQSFRDILLSDESVPIALTPAQSALLRVLWEQRGAPIHREVLIAQAKLDLDKPVRAFPRPKYPDANRAYQTFVRSNRQGMYWWAPEALPTVC